MSDNSADGGETKRRRILVIDDDETILELVKDVLSPEYEIRTSGDATRGLERLEKEPFDLLVLDLGLPGLSGIDAILRIRGEERHSNLPILVVSAYTDLARLVGDSQVQSVLAKPFSIQRLEERVAGLLKRASSVAQTGPIVAPAE
ncbi:MAG: response regulator [Rudaea sp.]